MPDVDVATNFFLVLTIVADVVVVFAVLCALAALVSSSARASVTSWAATSRGVLRLITASLLLSSWRLGVTRVLLSSRPCPTSRSGFDRS